MKVITKLNIDISHIAHIADVHIRNLKRHDEYNSVFNKLYSSLTQLKKKHPNLVIYLGGDIVHSKLDMTPELINVTYNFLKSCADIAPTFLILGNHDCNLNNKSRMDALSPIVNTINHPNLIFCKDTGIYRTNNIDFVVWSIIDDNKNYTIPKKTKNTQILFYHGAVDTAETDQGMQIKNKKLTLEKIQDFDYVLLGDIHKYQYLDGNKKIAYCGSTIQQNFGESLTHGYLLWDMLNEKSSFIKIKNDFGFYTLEIKNGIWVNSTLPSEFCKYPTIRVKAYDTSESDYNKQVSALRTNCLQRGIDIVDIKVQKITSKNDVTVSRTVKRGDIRDIEYQNKLIIDYLQKNSILNESLITEIYSINRELNSNVDIAKTIKNVTWVPIKFEFSNMFSYGEHNELSFRDMSGIYGLFASNASGKSSLLDALSFCIFDTCSRTFKASEVLNNKKTEFYSKFTFEIHNKEYVIIREGKKDKKGHVKVDVNFFTYNGTEQISLNGKDRASTNAVIREYIGNYDEFILTTLSLQNNNSNFVDKQQRERKDLLMQFLDLNLFEDLNEYASKEANQIKAIIKDFSKQDHPSKIAEATTAKKHYVELVDFYTLEKNKINQHLNDIGNEIILNVELLKHVDSEILELNEEDIISDIDQMSIRIDKCKEKIIELEESKKHVSIELDQIKNIIKDIDYIDLQLKAEKENKLKDYIKELNSEIQKIEIQIKHNKQKIHLLDNHEYDPNCKYCVKNEFVVDAIAANELLIGLQEQYDSVNNELQSINSEYINVSGSITLYEEYNNNTLLLSNKETKILEINTTINEISVLEVKLNSALNDLYSKFKIYKDNSKAIEHNKSIQSKIKHLQDEKDSLVIDFDKITNDLMNASAQVKIQENLIKISKEEINRISKLEHKHTAYELYLKATNRNGIPYDLIAQVLPQIEQNTNDILSLLVDFTIMLETDGKNINIFLSYDNTKIWPLELASGMERFISSLAIRNALITHSNLPRPNFIAIDEGFGVLDSENISAIYNMFQFLKEQYQFILIISHIDSLKDIAEKQIEIYKNDGVSNVFF